MELSEYGVLDLDLPNRRPIVVPTLTPDPQEVLGELLAALWY